MMAKLDGIIHIEKNIKIYTIMIQSYAKYKQFKSLVDAKENGKAGRSGLDFVEEVECNYGNRPALMRLPRN